MKITKEMFQKYIDANKTNQNGKKLDFNTYKKSGLDAEMFIYISDHLEELEERFFNDK